MAAQVYRSRSVKPRKRRTHADAMDMEVLRDMVKDCIVRHINPQTWSSELAIEEQERATLKQMMGELMGVA